VKEFPGEKKKRKKEKLFFLSRRKLVCKARMLPDHQKGKNSADDATSKSIFR